LMIAIEMMTTASRKIAIFRSLLSLGLRMSIGRMGLA
jgi:hypothetical protein